jgi:hypothetical protein
MTKYRLDAELKEVLKAGDVKPCQEGRRPGVRKLEFSVATPETAPPYKED